MFHDLCEGCLQEENRYLLVYHQSVAFQSSNSIKYGSELHEDHTISFEPYYARQQCMSVSGFLIRLGRPTRPGIFSESLPTSSYYNDDYTLQKCNSGRIVSAQKMNSDNF